MVAACPYPVPQGSQVLVKATARALAGRGHEIHLVVYGYGTEDADEPFPVHRAANFPGARRTAAGPSFAKPFQDLALAAALRKVVRERRPDLVHAHNYEALAVAVWTGQRPVVYHAHNMLEDELPYYFGGGAGARTAGRFLDGYLPSRADAVIALHRPQAERLAARGCRSDTLAVIPPPVDAEAFDLGAYDTALPPVVYMGNFDAYQNLPLLQRAMEIVRKAEPAARLVLATAAKGATPEGAERVDTPDLASLRAVLATDCVVACPRVSWSGYPMKLLNALAAGRPAVACRSAAHPLEDGVTGLVAPDDDAEAFAAALLRLLRDPALRRRLGLRARAAAVEHHAPDVIAQQIEALYEKVLAGR